MALYGGIDLHSRISWLVILDGALKVVRQTKLGNDLLNFLRVLEPYRAELAGLAVESTPNWYWLVDGLQEAGYRMHLTNTCAVQQYSGLKYTDDRHDARWLAHLLALGILPEGYIYPAHERPLRDLLRRRGFLVRKRTSLLLSLQGAFGCHTGHRVSSDTVKKWTAVEIEELLDNATVARGLTCLLEPIKALDSQIRMLEKEVLAQAKLRDEFALLRTVWGIGPILALTVMLEVGDIKRFEKVGNFASYCRLVKTDRLSVGKRKGSGNAKNGNPYLSWAFSEAAHFAIRYHDAAKRFYQRKLAKTNGIVAVRALAHKLARASYHVMRDKVEFNPDRLFA
jgi:transposase